MPLAALSERHSNSVPPQPQGRQPLPIERAMGDRNEIRLRSQADAGASGFRTCPHGRVYT